MSHVYPRFPFFWFRMPVRATLMIISVEIGLMGLIHYMGDEMGSG